MADKKGLENNREAKKRKKHEMADLPFTRVVYARTEESHLVYNVMHHGDRAALILRKGIGFRFKDVQEVLELLNEFTAATKKLSDVVGAMCKYANIDYEIPKTLAETTGSGEGGKKS